VTPRLAALQAESSKGDEVWAQRSHPRQEAARMGDHSFGARGSIDSRSCSRVDSVAEVDRRRVAPRGRERRARGIDDGSSFPTREQRKTKARRKPTLRWLSREIGGGSPQKLEFRESGSKGAHVDGRRSGPKKPVTLTRERGKGFWFLVSRPGFRTTRGATGSVRGIHRQPCTRLKTPWQGSAARSGARYPHQTEETVCDGTEARWCAVKRAST
jgi:hypothetical protein